MIAGQMVKANRTVDALVRPEVAGEGEVESRIVV